MRVTGGFLAGLELDLVDGLNCLIGGRGAGKTTALEFLRFGLGLMPDAKASPHRHRAIDSLVRANLGGGRISVDLATKTGMRYNAGRAYGDAVQVLNEQGTAVPVSLERDQIFGADVFSQNEIEEIATNPTAQLGLLDRFREEESVSIAAQLEADRRDLEQSSQTLWKLDQEIADHRAKASEVAGLQERLKGLVAPPGPEAASLNAGHEERARRAKEQRLAPAALATLTRVEQEMEQSGSALTTTIDGLVADELRAGRNRHVVAELAGAMQGFSRTFADSIAALGTAIRNTETAVRKAESDLAVAHAVQEAEYRSLVATSAEETGRAAERQALQVALAAAEGSANEQRAKERQREEVAQRRRAVLRRVSELRDRRFALRKQVAERLTNDFPVIRVTVQQAAGLEPYRELVAERLRGARLQQNTVADRLSEVFLPGELAEVIVQNNADTVAERTGYDRERIGKILEALRADGSCYEIEAIDLDDMPSIELRDGERFKESGRLSTGQRCTTILPILLVQSERPLLIDQPEDNLDNAFVYESVVAALRAVKGSRQVIFVTHNPNIPVLGEAERVFVFESDGEHALLRSVGTVDQCKAHIEDILEGGREAFDLRRIRYGH